MVWKIHRRLPDFSRTLGRSLHVPLALRIASGQMRRADDDCIPRHRGSRMQSHFARDQIDLLVVIHLQIDDTRLAERCERLPILRIQRDQPIAGRHMRMQLLAAIGPIRQAASRQPARSIVAAFAFIFRMHPLDFAGDCVERHHIAARPDDGIDHALGHQRRRFQVVLRPRSEVRSAETPGHLQRVEIRGVDLVQRRISRVA